MKVVILVYMDVERYLKKMTILNQRTIKVSRDCDKSRIPLVERKWRPRFTNNSFKECMFDSIFSVD